MSDQPLPTDSDAAEASPSDAEDAPTTPTPPLAPPPAARPAPRSTTAAPRIRIERGSTIYAPWKKDNPPPAPIRPGQVTPKPAAAPPAPVAPAPVVVPVVPVVPVPVAAPSLAEAERTLEMTREMLAQEIAPALVQPAAPPPVKAPAPDVAPVEIANIPPIVIPTPAPPPVEQVEYVEAIIASLEVAAPPLPVPEALTPAPTPLVTVEPIPAPAQIVVAPAEIAVEEKSAAPKNASPPAEERPVAPMTAAIPSAAESVETLPEINVRPVAEPAPLPVEEKRKPKTPDAPAPFVAPPPIAEVRAILPEARLAPGQAAPPSRDTGVLPTIDPARKNRRAPSIPEQLAEAEAKFQADAKAAPQTPYRLPTPLIPGYRGKNRENGKPPRRAPESEPSEERLPPEQVQERRRIVAEELRRFSPAAPGMARVLAIVGAVIAALGLLARPFSDWSSRLPFLAPIAHFSEGLETDSRFQWRNLRRREGRAISAGKRSQARVVVVLIPTKSGKGKGFGANLPAMDRRSVAGLMRLCNAAGVPAVGLAMDTATLPGSNLPPPPLDAAPLPDPLLSVIREIRQSQIGPRPTFTVLPAFLTQEGGAGLTGAPRLSLPDPRLPRVGLVTGFVGAPPAVSGAPDFASSPKNQEPRRSFVLVTRAFPARDPKASFSSGDSLRRALSFPAAIALLCLPDAALWFQEGGAEREDSGIPDGLASIFSWPAAPGAKTAAGERPCAIDYGLLQTDPEGVEVISANYLRAMSADVRRDFLEGRPVIIGVDRPVDRVSTPLSSRLFGVLTPLKTRMTHAEIEGRAAAMLLARAERRAQSALLPTLEADAEDRRGPNGESRTETPGALFSVANIPPPAPYMEPLIPGWRSWLAILPAALLGFFFMQAGRRVAAPPAPRYAPETARLRRVLSAEMRLRRSIPVLLCLALAGALGWLWRSAGTAGFGQYLDFPAFWPWAAPWATAIVATLAFGFSLLAAWILGPAFRGSGLGFVAVLAALGMIILMVADFVLFPAGTPLLAPTGAFLIGAAIPLRR